MNLSFHSIPPNAGASSTQVPARDPRAVLSTSPPRKPGATNSAWPNSGSEDGPAGAYARGLAAGAAQAAFLRGYAAGAARSSAAVPGMRAPDLQLFHIPLNTHQNPAGSVASTPPSSGRVSMDEALFHQGQTPSSANGQGCSANNRSPIVFTICYFVSSKWT